MKTSCGHAVLNIDDRGHLSAKLCRPPTIPEDRALNDLRIDDLIQSSKHAKRYGRAIDIIGELTMLSADVHLTSWRTDRAHHVLLHEICHTSSRRSMVSLRFEDLIASSRVEG